MKILQSFTLVYVLLQTLAYAGEVRVYTDYSPVRIFRVVGSADPDMAASEAGLKGHFKVMDESEIPYDRTDRDAWKMKNGAISVNPALKAEKELKRSEKEAAVEKLKASTGLTDSELIILGLTDAK